jgi:hypothetical protein
VEIAEYGMVTIARGANGTKETRKMGLGRRRKKNKE